MKNLMIALGAILVLCGPVHAQIDPGPDGIGLYTDLAATQNNTFWDGNPLREIHLLGTNLTADTPIYGVDLSLRLSHPDRAIFGDMWAPNGGVTLDVLPMVFVSFLPGTLMPGTIVHFATITVIILSPDPVEVFIGEAQGGDIIQGWDPYYAVGPDSDRVFLNPSSGSQDLPVFRFNGPGPVDNESVSWGGVKTLFR